ncbi:MAG: 2-C-methyl-D-erythritol 4-phosphate cytidylyltransferase [Elusimicrobiota bacterium]|nr:2-C-methyl-D-erythritol 4-phosphate cytidylyltransferase [Endomicrobiia bacterium]MCX7910268.1 2-C-methyl-D-erythritol 4-phosphate cytidylyltransferase [Endomicrobiia bacterium]MDW8165328.1 2-C-methyl-D-erythritol 4-phosphate cytidylyltransferase [Elusimicrobiota bacterium]
MEKISVILLAAGKSKRFKHSTKKQFIKIKNKLLLEYVIDKFITLKYPKQIILVIDKNDIKKVENLHFKKEYKDIKIVFGGKERYDSVFNASKYVDKDAKIVLIHDIARPLISKNLIYKCIKKIKNYDCVIPVIPIVDTIKLINSKYEIIRTQSRENLVLAQTPQVFKKKVFDHIYSKNVLYKWIKKNKITDDSQIAELEGYKVKGIIGEKTNIKLTTKEDLYLLKTFVN